MSAVAGVFLGMALGITLGGWLVTGSPLRGWRMLWAIILMRLFWRP
jgi:hypothetical protein